MYNYNIAVAFEEVCKSAERRGIRVTGSEVVGLVPLSSLLEAGRYFLRKQKRSLGVCIFCFLMSTARYPF